MKITRRYEKDDFKFAEIDNSGVLYVTGYRSEKSSLDVPAELNGMRVAGVIGMVDNSWVFDKFVGRIENTDRVSVIDTSIAGNHVDNNCSETGVNVVTAEDKENEVVHNATGKISDKNSVKVDNIQYIALSEGITMVGCRAFSGFTAMQMVVLPDSLKVIDDLGFENCRSLKNITIPAGVELIGECAFSNCEALKEVTIPGNVKVIGYSAFEECHSLETITICEGVEEIGANAFLACKKLTRIDLPESIKIIYGYGEFSPFAYCSSDLIVTYKGKEYRVADDEAQALNLAVNGKLFKGSLLENIPDTPANEFKYVELEDGTLCITDYTGSSNSVKIPEELDGKTVSCTDEGMIARCGIEVIEFPTTLSFQPCFIEEYYDYFTNDDKAILKAVKLNGSEKLPEYLFNGCANLREVSFPDSFVEMSYGLFWDCSRLRYINLPSVISTDKWSDHTAFENCSSIKKFVIPAGVKEFSASSCGGYVELGVPNMEQLILPETLEKITELPFVGVPHLKSLTIPDTVKVFEYDNIFSLFYEGEGYIDPDLKVTFHGKTYGTIYYREQYKTADNGEVSDWKERLVYALNDGDLFDDVRDLMDCELPENWTKDIDIIESR